MAFKMEPCKRPRASPVACFGEALLRFEALEPLQPLLPQRCLRSVGGDELNVAVVLAGLQVASRWISVLPTGPLGDVVRSCERNDLEFKTLEVEGDLGIFTLLKEQQTVHYQRTDIPSMACGSGREIKRG